MSKDNTVDKILEDNNILVGTGAKLTEIGYERLGENIQSAKQQIQALITEARVDGRKDAIGCSSVIEQEWRAYRGSSSYLEVALETINQTQLKENK